MKLSASDKAHLGKEKYLCLDFEQVATAKTFDDCLQVPTFNVLLCPPLKDFAGITDNTVLE